MDGQTAPRRVLLLENPRSGQSLTDLSVFTSLLEARGVEITLRPHLPGVPFADLLTDVRAFDAVVAVGGDGTASSVAFAMRGSNVPLLVYPAGTANLIAQNLHLRADPAFLADVLLSGQTIVTDLGQLHAGTTMCGFTLMAGVGADAVMIKDSEELKPRLGVGAYVVSALRQLTPKAVKFNVTIDGRTIETEGISVVVANFGMVNFRLPVASGIDPTDGVLSIIVVKASSPLSLVPNVIDSVRMRFGLGDPMFDDNLEFYEGREVHIEAEEHLPIQFDGESFGERLPLTARVLPGAARFLTHVELDRITT
ncbi:diacylglycerol/lipid kinase family protein [Deinococcus yavapaiensis]|uniref:Diacylglycerol kinase family enzyme n=1 Tax=Deinococcus yavapaiensis KR-236 TaxID=694435 RepID=A0A318S7M3_9DEIO|nr:diacylglycerol kinase family protein [Deinococcus yavapaiensis]PYE53046.1 diacylglycerol kinase family enzyme [Deinococcus yavapaiensis KR-236]